MQLGGMRARVPLLRLDVDTFRGVIVLLYGPQDKQRSMEKKSKARIKKLQACVAQLKTQRKEVSEGPWQFRLWLHSIYL